MPSNKHVLLLRLGAAKRKEKEKTSTAAGKAGERPDPIQAKTKSAVETRLYYVLMSCVRYPVSICYLDSRLRTIRQTMPLSVVEIY